MAVKLYAKCGIAVEGAHVEEGEQFEVATESEANYLISCGRASKSAPGKASKDKASAAD